MAKKKKTQLKPVARGFATTSVPKKVITVVQTEDQPNVPGVSASLEDETERTENVKEASCDMAVQPNEAFDADKVEEQSLQNLVDKLQEKTEKDILRTVKVCRWFCHGKTSIVYLNFQAIGMERRFSKSLPRLELDPGLTNRILDLILSQATPGDISAESFNLCGDIELCDCFQKRSLLKRLKRKRSLDLL